MKFYLPIDMLHSELNAVLRPYNIVADRGKEGSRIYDNNGLVYRVLDEQGNKIGTPIKASDIYNKPTMKFLEQKICCRTMKLNNAINSCKKRD
jgi:hypothetical protein